MKTSCIIHIDEKGKLANKKVVAQAFNILHPGKWLLEINSYNKRTDPQNRYYWGLVVPIIQKGIKDLGTDLTKEETHEFLKARFNISDLVNEQTGEAISIPLSTTRLNKEQFGEYIEKIQQFAAEFLSVEIPDPGTQTKIFSDGTAMNY